MTTVADVVAAVVDADRRGSVEALTSAVLDRVAKDDLRGLVRGEVEAYLRGLVRAEERHAEPGVHEGRQREDNAGEAHVRSPRPRSSRTTTGRSFSNARARWLIDCFTSGGRVRLPRMPTLCDPPDHNRTGWLENQPATDLMSSPERAAEIERCSPVSPR